MSQNLRDLMILAVATEAHAGWQKTWRATNGDEPKFKPTADAAWIEAHGGVTEVDIAHTDFIGLPSEWQEENGRSARIAVDHVSAGATWLRRTFGFGRRFVQAGAAKIHEAWVEHNSHKPWCTEEQKRPYAQLSMEEQAKDDQFVWDAIKVYMKMTRKK